MPVNDARSSLKDLNTKKELEEYFERHPQLKHRKYRKQVIENLTQMSYEQYKLAATIDRYFRKLPNDGGEHARQTKTLNDLGYSAASLADYAERPTLL